ncbi:ChaN family lipoprotein [Nitrosovibrio sp. Nv17]|uniref:ChaN family lipoprotein n=1 Tax=Nitrosovibrio sp. Nv17 TaxID=1855339 RepID=UPI00092FFAEC|nr:ChaN family lipoprotein [Nitrosovibrio sp. Nv17]
MPAGAAPARAAEGTACVPVGSWVVPGAAEVAGRDVFTRAARNAVLLLGETHDNPEHHRWQLQTLAALYALRPDMVIGFEMFPRRVQPVLDRWVAGELSESQFLDAVDWGVVWSTDATLYLPLFHFARMNRIPMVALNIDTRLRRAVSQKGFDAIPEAEREGVTPPAAPGPAYLDYLLPFYREHVRDGKKRLDATRDDPDFRRFVGTQQLWDRAMAQALHAALAQPNRPLVVGVMGSGHIRHGYGVAHQLRDLGVPDVGALLPWNSGADCGQVVVGLADAVFGVAPPSSVPPGPPRQRLGIRFELVQGGARVLQVEKGSIAEAAGVRDGDVILEAAGVAIGPGDDIAEIVRRQAPGTWLPLKLKRGGGDNVEAVAKFPALPR